MLRTLLSGLPVIQVAVVVHDLEACAARQSASLGNGPWRVYDLGPHVIDHVGVVVDSVDDVVSQAAAERIGVLSGGEGFGVDGSGKFAYLDTHAALGMIFEVIEPPTSLGESARRL